MAFEELHLCLQVHPGRQTQLAARCLSGDGSMTGLPVERFSRDMDQRWRVVGTSVPGVRHRRRGEPCQDVFRRTETADGTLVIAVADGAGSAEFAEVGARRAVEGAVAGATAALSNGPPSQ